MNKKDEIKIEVLSNIDDKIIDKQTVRRYSLMLKNKYSRKKLAGWISAAASFVLICSFLFAILLPAFTGQIPVYTGMTVSKSMPGGSDIARWQEDQPGLLKNGINPTALISRGDMVMLSGTDASPETEAVDIPDSLKIAGDDRSLYYAKKNEDIYITIHIDNPKEFEILSFTLNGVKYQAYMFEDGSTSERLVLKVNVGDAQGIIDYTIDAIKYVDGTEIKDVRMEGERTVSVGVYPEEQPAPNITNLTVGYEEISFDVLINDPMSLINNSNGNAVAVLFDGDTIVEKQELSLEESNAIVFSKLTPGKEYRYCIIANYDAFDGQGFVAHMLEGENRFEARSHVTITNISVTDTRISFDPDTSGNDTVEIQSIDLMTADGRVLVSGDAAVRSFENVYFGKYSICITYTYDTADGKKTGYVKTADDIAVVEFASLQNIVVFGKVGKGYSGDVQVYNKTTKDYRFHTGVDIFADEGTPLYSAFNGTVDRIWYDDFMGHCISVKYDEGCYLIYQNLGSVADGLSEGDRVIASQQIASIGKSAKLEKAEDPHLHFELMIKDQTVNPLDYFKYVGLQNIVAFGTEGKGYSGDVPVYNKTTGDRRYHTGVDIFAEEGTPVYSAFNGTVDRIWYDDFMGHCISVKYDEGCYLIYQNLGSVADGLSEGDRVIASQQIASIGKSAKLEKAEDPHLHFELMIKDQTVNPLDYFDDYID